MALLDDLCACDRHLLSARKITTAGVILLQAQQGADAPEFVLLKPKN